MRQITTLPADQMRECKRSVARRLKALLAMSIVSALLTLIARDALLLLSLVLFLVLVANLVTYLELKRQVDQKFMADLKRRGFDVISVTHIEAERIDYFTAFLNGKKVSGAVKEHSTGQRSIWADISHD